VADVTHAHSPALVRLVARLRSEEDLLRSAAEAARAHGRADKALPEAEVRRHIVALLDAVLAIVSGNGEEVAAAAAAADQLAVDRAHQGISLPVLMSGVQSARAVLLQALMTTGREFMSAEDLLPVLAELDARVNELQMGMLPAYRSAEQDLSRTARTARVEALRELINGGPVSWAGEAGLDADRSYRCLVADVSTPRDSRRVDALMDTADGVSGIVNGYLCRVTSQLPPSHRLADTLVAASPPVPPAQLPTAYLWCREALAVYRASGARGLRPVSAAAVNIALAGHEPLGRMLADELLAPLDPRDEFHRLLADTARVYLAHGSKADVTAAALHVHPNTVKYRIRRLAELTGGMDVTKEPEEALSLAVRWWWALATWLETAPPTR
jgi:DNA-binding PucR family transcriptional regulator